MYISEKYLNEMFKAVGKRIGSAVEKSGLVKKAKGTAAAMGQMTNKAADAAKKNINKGSAREQLGKNIQNKWAGRVGVGAVGLGAAGTAAATKKGYDKYNEKKGKK